MKRKPGTRDASRRLTLPERRKQLLSAATRLFARHGFSGTRFQAIARECGITEALIFHHFHDKKALYQGILDSRLNRPEREVLPPFSRFGNDDAAFLSFVASGLLARMESEPLFMRLLLYGALEGHPMADAFVERRIRRSAVYLARYVSRRRRQGAFRKVDPDVAARAFLGMVVHHSLLTHLFKYPLRHAAPREALVRTWVALFLDGVRGRP